MSTTNIFTVVFLLFPACMGNPHIETVEVDKNRIVGLVRVPQTPYGFGMDTLYDVEYDISVISETVASAQQSKRRHRSVDKVSLRMTYINTSKKVTQPVFIRLYY